MDIKKMVADGVVEGFASLMGRNHSNGNGNGNGEGNNPPANVPPAPVPTSTQLASQPQQGQTDEHPVLTAAFAAGVKTADDFASLKADADAYAKEVNDAFKSEAVRKFGSEKGLEKFNNYAKLSHADKKALTAEWCEASDEKYGIGKNGEAASRETAAAQLPNAANAEGASTTGGNHNGNGSGSGSDDSAWAKLSKDEQDFATKMGYATPEAREKFAAEALRLKGAAK